LGATPGIASGDAAMTTYLLTPSAAAFDSNRITLPRALRRRGVLARFLAAIFESRQRQVERDIARLVGNSGGKLTDAMERDIERRLFNRV
jgi:hypothetical protein